MLQAAPQYDRCVAGDELQAEDAAARHNPEGRRRATPADFARFLNIAPSSAGEADYLLLLTQDLGYAPEDKVAPLRAELDEIGAMLHALRRKVEQGG